MNPYLKILPSLKPDFSGGVVLNDIIEENLVEVIRDYNLLTYLDFSERLPEQSMIENNLSQRGITTPHLSALLWTLGQSFEILPVPMLPKVEQFNQLHYIVNNSTIIDALLRSALDSAAELYKSIHGKEPNLDKIKSISENPIYYSEMGDEHQKLYIRCKISSVLAHYDELLHSDLEFMSSERLKERRRGAVSVLERHANRHRANMQNKNTLLTIVNDESGTITQDNAPVSKNVSSSKSSDDLHFTINDVDISSNDESEEPNQDFQPKKIINTPPIVAQTAPRRAIDIPQWKDYELKHKDGLSWSMVLEKFGGSMVIRILLRRKDYRQLLAMIQGKFITSEIELKNCRAGLEKIKMNNDIQEENAAAYSELYEYLRSQGY